MENIIVILHISNKGKVLNTLEIFHIYKETKLDNEINNKCAIRPNIIFDTVNLKETNRWQSPI
jgi:hypothetical protein